MEKKGFLPLPTPSKDDLSLPPPLQDDPPFPTGSKDDFPLPALSRQPLVPYPSENELHKSGPDKVEAATPFGKKENDPNAKYRGLKRHSDYALTATLAFDDLCYKNHFTIIKNIDREKREKKTKTPSPISHSFP